MNEEQLPPSGEQPSQKENDAASAPVEKAGQSRFRSPELQIDQAVIAQITQTMGKINREVSKVIVGQQRTLELMMTAILTGGHILIEGVPGIAKTLTAKLFARAISASFSRIQFTPDLMPTDVSGTSIFNLKTSDFTFKKGPIFANLVLIDEINRAPAKTQAALFEVMEEKQLTYDGIQYEMEYPFFVLGTQNPIEQEGTYKLPEAQLDRFLFRLKVDYPSQQDEIEILKRFRSDFDQHQMENVKPVLSTDELKKSGKLIEKVYIHDDLLHYIAAVMENTRNNADLFLGASPRASLALMKTSKAIAAIRGRDFVVPDDIKQVAGPVLNHRLILTPEKEMEGAEVEDVIHDILEQVEIPR